MLSFACAGRKKNGIANAPESKSFFNIVECNFPQKYIFSNYGDLKSETSVFFLV